MKRFHPTKWFQFGVFIILASLDNAAAGVLPPLYIIIARDLSATTGQLGLVTSIYILIAAGAAIGWGYQGDRLPRKPLLLAGTAVWASAMLLTGTANNFAQFLIFQLITAVGVGAVGSIGFSLVSDIIPAQHRGAALSLWSISQGAGNAFGALMGGTLGAFDWRWPFWLVGAIGIFFAALYAITPEPERGQSDPELKALFANGKRYNSRIQLKDLRMMWQQTTTKGLLWEAFFFSLAYGATVWIPSWAIARVQAEGYSLETSTIVGNLIVLLFSVGTFSSVFIGHWGDRLQRRSLRARPRLAMVGLLCSIPFFITLYFVPFRGLELNPEGSTVETVLMIAQSIITNPWIITAFAVAFVAQAFQATDPPNWAAMITDANLPEHRGTAVGISRLFRAVGNALSVGLAGFLFTWLQNGFSETTSFSIGLAIFQLLVIPAAICYRLIIPHIEHDITAVRQTMQQRATTILHPPSPPLSPTPSGNPFGSHSD